MAAPSQVAGETTYPVGNSGNSWFGGSVATLQTPALDMPQAHAPRPDDTLPMLKVPSHSAPRPAEKQAPPQMVVNGLVLPTPPVDEEKYQYVRRHAWVITLLGAASFPLLLFSQVRMIFLFHWFWLYFPFLLLSAIFLALPMFTDAMSRGFNFKTHQGLVNSWHPTRYPSVDVFLPVCGEPIEVLRNTWKYVSLMSDYYQGTVTAYVLDDSHNPQLKEMAAGFGFVYATRPNRGWFKKSGNLWFGYQVSSSMKFCLTWTRTRKPGLCKPRSTSGSPTTRPGWNAAAAPSRSCSTGLFSPPEHRKTARFAVGAAPSTGERHLRTTWA
jgi:hypothetical protein